MGHKMTKPIHCTPTQLESNRQEQLDNFHIKQLWWEICYKAPTEITFTYKEFTHACTPPRHGATLTKKDKSLPYSLDNMQWKDWRGTYELTKLKPKLNHMQHQRVKRGWSIEKAITAPPIPKTRSITLTTPKGEQTKTVLRNLLTLRVMFGSRFIGHS